MLKLIFHLETHDLLGVHIIGEGASELVHIGQAVMSFGGRMFVGRMSQVFMIQTISILVASYLSPAALALFARPRSLVRERRTTLPRSPYSWRVTRRPG